MTSGCAKKETPSPESAVSQAPAKSAFDPSTAATLAGKVLFTGQAPAPKELSIKGNPECSVFHKEPLYSEELLVKDGAVQNVFVYVKEGLEGMNFPPPAAPVTIENKGCVYLPHVTGAQVGQPVIFLNEDPTLHNIHSFPKNSRPWNLGLPFQGMKQTKSFSAPEVMVPLKCDVHPWMTGYIGVLAHPYFAVSDENGKFEIKNLPPGDYVIEAWHEKLGAQTQKVHVEPRERKGVDFTF
ncbi:MAG: hypothetical protein HYZ52_00700 [Candidatus Omnitrophica bacterium]|nr:hypothetical protein [Candidatus Omnitrophota bacterium]